MREGPRKAPSWMAELFFEAAVVPAAALPEVSVVERPAEPGFSRADLLGPAASGPEPPRTFAAYKALMESLFNPLRDQALKLMQREPVFATAREVWRKGQGQANANVVSALSPFVVKALEQAYGFAAPPVDYKPAAGFLGQYDVRHHRILITPALFQASLKDFLDTLIHEEMHAFQADLILMLNVQRKGRVLTPPERALAQYWKNEEPKYRSALAAGSAMSPETKARYRMIGQEYHAWTTAHYLASRLAGS
ncbi:MAG: hypothetical protein VKO21_09730 [Candidatus Sericytochromatia bacterium]|nr:hypothetical protein [Candidatus Sericytochromatia bacterium]